MPLETPLTRRDCAKSLAALAAPIPARSGREFAVENEGVAFRLAVREGKCIAREFTNRIANERIELPLAGVEFEFAGGDVVRAADFTITGAKAAGPTIDIEAASRKNLGLRIRYEAPAGKAYLRKRIWVRSTGQPLRLVRADLDNWSGVRRHWDSMHADSLPYGSHPIYCDSLWAGVEFVTAFNRYSPDGFVLRSRPGGKQIGSDWVELRSTVFGVAKPGAVRDAFLAYIEDVRLAPPRFIACYNSWWTLPLLVKQAEYLALMRELKAQLADKHGVFFDIVATDAGWNDPHSIWQIDRKNLPNGFDDMRAIVEAAGGKPGLWISPSEEYKPNFDYDWGRRNGYVVLKNTREGAWAWNEGVSLADPKYREQTKAQLQKLIKENGFDHIKYDGFVAREEEGHDGLWPGDDSVEPLAEYSLELMQVSKQANPKLITEPTYLNSGANYISPWIIKYSDTVWANAGGDCPLAISAAPDYREAHTSAREYFIFRSLDEVWLPQNALQYFDIVHCDDEPGFANHAAMAAGRGRFFLSTYLNPKFMTEDDWRVYAGLLKWARKNTGILKNTKVLPSRVEDGDPYAYAHWLGNRGVIAVRNPSNETREYSFELERSGAPRSLANGVCYTQYPYRKGIATQLNGTSRLHLKLAPWELLFLEIAPSQDLRELVVIGGRWFNGSFVPDAGRDSVLLVEAGRERTLPAQRRTVAPLTGQILAESRRRVGNGTEFSCECFVAVPQDAAGRVLLLVQFPGRKHYKSTVSATVNGSPVTLTEKSSAGHIGYYMPSPNSPWKEALPYEAQWTWYIADVKTGESRVAFTGTAAHDKVRLGVWAWADRDLRNSAVRLNAPASEPEMPQYQEHLEREGYRLI